MKRLPVYCRIKNAGGKIRNGKLELGNQEIKKRSARKGKKMFQYVLFDLDGTLTDPKEGITKSVQFALHQQGIHESDLDKLEPFIGPPLQDSFMEFYGMTQEQAAIAIADYRKRFAPVGIFENKVYPGIPEMLMHLKAAGMQLAVASSKPEEFVRRILEHFSLEQYFDVVVGSNLDGTRSEKEEVVEEALRQLTERATETDGETEGSGISAEASEAGGKRLDHTNCVMVGDRKFDVSGARKHGLTAVGVSYGYAGRGELEAAGADFIAGSVRQLEKFLLRGDGEHPENGKWVHLSTSDSMTPFRKTWDILFPLILYYIGYNACYIVILTLVQLFANAGGAVSEWMQNSPALFANLARGCSMLAGAGILLPLLRRERTSWERRTSASYLTFGILAGTMALGFNLLFSLLRITELSSGYARTVQAQYQIPILQGLILFGLVSPLTEELLFRGLIYNRIKRFFRVNWSILISALLFGFYHGNLVQALYGMILGAMIAYAYEMTGSLKIPVFVHSAANCVVFLLTYDKDIFSAVNTPLNCAIFLIISFLSLMNIKRRQKN